MSKKIAILGAGNGAFAMASDLALQGFEVAIWSSKKARLEAIWETKTIEVVGPTVQGQAKLALVTDHIGDAIRGADVICMPIPAFSQPEAAAALVPFIEDGQVIFLAPGSFGSFLMARKMRELGCFKEFAICETGTLPYLTRKTKPNESSIIVRACSLPTGVFPARLTGMAIEKLKKVVPTVHAVEDVLSGALMNAGPIIHPPLVVMNTGPIENQHSYDIHNEGTSAGIRLVQRDLDAERIILRKAFGYAPKHYPLDDYYNDGAEDEWMYPRESKKLLMSSRLWDEKVDYSHRYVTEDIALGLAFMVSVAGCAGVEVPTASSLLRIAGIVVGEDYLKTGRTLTSLGLGSLSTLELQKLLRDGFTNKTAKPTLGRQLSVRGGSTMGESIAVVGPGRMGVGIVTATLLANQGHSVTLFDMKEREPGQEMIALEKAICEIQDNMMLLGELGMWVGDAEKICEDIGVSRNLSEISRASFIFEALPEKVELKKDFFAAVGGLIGEETVIASATSTFHLQVFLDVCSKPGNIVTAHWLNPAFLIPLVEIAHNEKTHHWAVERTQSFLRSIGKIPVTMKSSPGFIVPRIQVAAMNEAIRILEEGVTTAEEIDTAIKAGFGFRLGVMGLMEFIDLGGVDILFHAGNYLHSTLGGNHYKPPELVSEKMRLNEMGPRTGKGIFDYSNIDTSTMFQEKYRGFVELLNLYKKSAVLRFAGGIKEKD